MHETLDNARATLETARRDLAEVTRYVGRTRERSLPGGMVTGRTSRLVLRDGL